MAMYINKQLLSVGYNGSNAMVVENGGCYEISINAHAYIIKSIHMYIATHDVYS